MNKNIILNHQEIEHKIKRIAYQIHETFIDEEEIVIAGIANNGFILAEKISMVLKSISNLKISLCEVTINKQNPFAPITTSIPKEAYTNKGLILVDDVLNSGKTLMYAVKLFLDKPVKKINTVVLVDRSHTRFPVKADFVGLTLSTTLQERIEADFSKKNKEAVYLN